MKPPRKRALRKIAPALLRAGLRPLDERNIPARDWLFVPDLLHHRLLSGFALAPGVEGQYQREGTSYVRINSDGLRDREHPKAKPAGTFRIAVLGDSFTEAMHVPMEQTFGSCSSRNCNSAMLFPVNKSR
jgi:hypothetical protein